MDGQEPSKSVSGDRNLDELIREATESPTGWVDVSLLELHAIRYELDKAKQRELDYGHVQLFDGSRLPVPGEPDRQ